MNNPTVTKTLDVSGFSDEAIACMLHNAKLADAIIDFAMRIRMPLQLHRVINRREVITELAKSIAATCDHNTQDILLRKIDSEFDRGKHQFPWLYEANPKS